MFKNIIKAWFGSAGKSIMTVGTLFIFYLSPGVSLQNTDGDTQGWGLLAYVLFYLPVYTLAMIIYTIFSLRTSGYKTILAALTSYFISLGILFFVYYHFAISINNSLKLGIIILLINLGYLFLLDYLVQRTVPMPPGNR